MIFRDTLDVDSWIILGVILAVEIPLLWLLGKYLDRRKK